MQPKVSFPRSENPITCPYPEPNQPSPRTPIVFKIRFNITLLCTPRSSKCSFLTRTAVAMLLEEMLNK